MLCGLKEAGPLDLNHRSSAHLLCDLDPDKLLSLFGLSVLLCRMGITVAPTSEDRYENDHVNCVQLTQAAMSTVGPLRSVAMVTAVMVPPEVCSRENAY